LPEKNGLKITLVFASGRRRIQARCKDLVKVTVPFTGGGKCFQWTKGKELKVLSENIVRKNIAFPVPHTENGSKDSKC
jgi:hypothetical protein